MAHSVTFPIAYGGDGSTITDDADPNTGLANGGHRERFVPALAGSVVMAGHAKLKADQTTADAAQTALDRQAVAADLAQTGQDRAAVETALTEAETRIGTTQALVDARDAAQAAQGGAETAESGAIDAQAAAEAARDAATVSGSVYADTAAGLAATIDGDYFKTPALSVEGFLTLYRNDAGSATEVETFPSLNGLATAIRAVNEKTTRLNRSLQRHGDFGQTLHADFAGDAYGLGSPMSGGVDQALAGEELFTVFERATPKWVLGPSGKYVEVSVNTIAREWDANGNPLGALFETSATNLLTWSEPADGHWPVADNAAAWAGTPQVKSGITLDRYVAGSVSLADIPSTSNVATIQMFFYDDGTDPGNTQVIRLEIHGNPEITRRVITFSHTTKSFGINGETGVEAWSVTHLGGGLYHVVLTINDPSITNVSMLRVAIYGDNRWMGGFHLEEGPDATSYIRTLDAPATRAADGQPARTLGPEFNPSSGTIFIDKGDSEGTALFSISIGSGAANYLGLNYATTGIAFFQPFAGYINAGINAGHNSPHKYAAAWKILGPDSVHLTIVRDGIVAVDTTYSGDTSTIHAWDTISVGGRFGAFTKPGLYKGVRLYPEARTAAKLQEMTQ